jgi:hypothetical protein
MFVVATATFRRLYTLIVLSLDPDGLLISRSPQSWLSGQTTEVLPCSCSILARACEHRQRRPACNTTPSGCVSFARHLRGYFEQVY